MYRLEQKQKINSILRANDLPSAEEFIENSFHEEWAADELKEYPDESQQSDVTEAADRTCGDDIAVRKKKLPEVPISLPALWKYPTVSRPRSAIIQEFTEDYYAYIALAVPDEGDDKEGRELLEKLIVHLGDLCTYIIYRKIHTFFFYQPGDEMDLANMGHINAIRSLRADRSAGVARNCPAAYYCKIYKNVTLDLLRYYGICRKKDDKTDAVSKIGRSSPYPIRQAVSLEKLTSDPDDGQMSDYFDFMESASDVEDRKFHSTMCREILNCYFRALLNYDHTPPAPLALMYARVLYNVERLLNSGRREAAFSSHTKKKKLSEAQSAQAAPRFFSNLDAKASATSAQWAMTRMGNATIARLIADSETTLQLYYDKSLKWGSGILRRLKQPVAKDSATMWQDVIYTDTFSQRAVAQYALDCHKSMLSRAADEIRQNSELMDYLRNCSCGGSLIPYLSPKKKHNKSKYNQSKASRTLKEVT